MAVAATIGVNIVARMDDFTSALNDVGDRLKTAGRSISDMGSSLTTGLTLPLAAAATAIGLAVEKASDLEEAQSAVNQIFGAAGPEILEFASTAANAMGMAQTEALNAAKNFGIFGKAAGLSGQDLVGFTSELTVLASDMASFNNTTPEQAILAIGAALRGESEPIRNYGVLLDDATLRQKALEMGIIATTKNALTPQQRVLAAQAAIFEQTSAQQGDFARTSEGLANTQRRLKAQLENVTTELGAAFLPVALQVASIVGDYVVPAIQKFGDFLQGIPTPVLSFVTAAGALLAALGPVLVVVGKLITAIGAISNPIGITVAAIIALGTAFTFVYSKSETFRAMMDRVWEGMKAVYDGLKGMVIPALQGVADTVSTVVGLVTDIIGGFVGGVVDVMGFVLPDGVKRGMQQFHQNLVAPVRGAIDTAKQIISELRAPSLDLGVTGSNAAATNALYGPMISASSEAGAAVLGQAGASVSAAQDTAKSLEDVTKALREYQSMLIDGAELGVLNQQETRTLFDEIRKTREGLSQANVTLDQRIVLTKDLNSLEEAAAGLLGKVNAGLAVSNDRFMAVNVATNLTAQNLMKVHEQMSVFDLMKQKLLDFGGVVTDIARDKLNSLGGSAVNLISNFTPLGMIATILSNALQEVEPLLKALEKPLEIVGAILGKALAPILEALFPVFKLLAIAATYIGQVFFKIAEGVAKAIGYLIRAIGKAIDALPGVSAKGVIAAGDALINVGKGFGEAYDALGDARDEIRGITLGGDEDTETKDLLSQNNVKQEEIAANTEEMVTLMKEQQDQPKTVNVTVQVTGGDGNGTQIGRQIVDALDDYFGRQVVYEERNLGRVGAF